MIFTFLKLEYLKASRSTAFTKSILMAVFLAFVALMLLVYLLSLGILLKYILENSFKSPDAYDTLSGWLIYFFLFEFIYRYFIQRLPVIELQHFLHLPIKKSWIIHFLLAKSFISPLNLIALFLFAPFSIIEIGLRFGSFAGLSWLLSVLLTSFSIHWIILWFKQKFEDSLTGLLVVFAVLMVSLASNYLGWFDLGAWMKPYFDWSLISVGPPLILLLAFALSYQMTYRFYLKHAYLEILESKKQTTFLDQELGIFKRFGLAGEMANLEWKLIIRHKKSRSYLMLSAFFLLYGLLFYASPSYATASGFNHMFIFVGTFITGIFVFQYGQLFFSWNSNNFDFFLNQKRGLEALVKGKYLLFLAISAVCFLVSVPYVYFGLDILFIHIATFLFNMGVIVHGIVYLSIWKPKPMDLNKGAMFNYEGIGIAQILMMLPMLALPYLVYLPFALWINQYAGLLAMSVLGTLGLFAYRPLVNLSVRKVLATKYEIASSFRQEV